MLAELVEVGTWEVIWYNSLFMGYFRVNYIYYGILLWYFEIIFY